MSETKPLRLFSYTRAASDHECNRKRYLSREWGGTGLQLIREAWPLLHGNIVHKALEDFAKTSTVDYMALRVKVRQAALDSGMDQIAARDWAALVEGQVRGFIRSVWPLLMAEYDLVEAEKWIELDFPGGYRFRARQDLLLKSKFDGHYCMCLEPNTRLLTSDLRWVSAGSVQVGDELAGVEEYHNKKNVDKNGQKKRTARHWQSGTVTKTSLVKKQCYEILLSDGTKFICSGDHSWLIANMKGLTKAGGTADANWQYTKNIKIGAKFQKVIEPWNNTINDWDPYDAGYVGAALDGEGCLMHRNPKTIGGSFHLTFSQNKNKMLKKFKSILAKYDIAPKTYDVKGVTNLGLSKCTQTNLCGKAATLRLLGITRPERLLAKFKMNSLGGAFPIYRVVVESITPVGEKEVVAIETTSHTFIAEGFISHNCDYKNTSSTKPQWIASWGRSVQMHSSMFALNQSTDIKVERCLVVGLSKGYKDEKLKTQRSPFNYGWVNREFGMVPQYSYEYQRSKGWELFSTAEEFEDLEEWVAKMPQSLLSEQFPTTAPIFYREDIAQEWFNQQLIREAEVGDAAEMLQKATTVEEITAVLRKAYRQNFSHCKPAYGYGCEFEELCWIPHVQADPLASGLFKRYQSELEIE